MPISALPPGLDPERYEMDEDGLPRELVGEWVRDKHARVDKYVAISASVRKKFIGKAGASFIELFSGPGRARIRDTKEVVSGSSLVAWKASVKSGAKFSQVYVADAVEPIRAACEERLQVAGAPVAGQTGAAASTVDTFVSRLNRYGLCLALLDPYRLDALPFSIIRKLATVKRMDLLIHVSAQDLNRNLRKYISRPESPIDVFAPGWREHVDLTRADDSLIRGKILEHWRNLLKSEGMTTTETHERVTGGQNQPLYWLAFAARHERALEFWEKIRDISPKKQISLL